MVDFQLDDDPETSGDGSFLLDDNQDIDLGFIHYENVDKCNLFLVDKPPHNSDYFLLQMLAVKNYYNSVSNNFIDFNIGVIDTVFKLNNNLKYYSTSDAKIGELFSESIDKLNLAIDSETLSMKGIYSDDAYIQDENTLYVVFHAGLGQESSTDFDPTIYDIRSAYIEENMLSDNWLSENNINEGLVLPETLNMIYYDVIEDAIPTNLAGDDLENIYCDQQFGMTGLFSYLVGYAFGYPPLHNFDNGQTRVGVFELMDVGFFNGHGVIPSPPSAWIRSNDYFNFNVDLKEITDLINTVVDTSYTIPCRSCDYEGDLVDQIYKLDISNDEYFLIENRKNSLSSDPSETIENKKYKYYQGFEDGNFDLLPYWFKNESGNLISNFSPAWFDILINDYTMDVQIDGENQITNINFNNNSNNYNVITSISNYDAGLPGSGLLIWHINEPLYNNGYAYGINDDILNKAITLEEGDGSNDIGDLDLFYGLFSNEKYISGKPWDFWYFGNAVYKSNNNINTFNNNTNGGTNLSNNNVNLSKKIVANRPRKKVVNVVNGSGTGGMTANKDKITNANKNEYLEIVGNSRS